jgi:PAS domain S-box-containing protein
MPDDSLPHFDATATTELVESATVLRSVVQNAVDAIMLIDGRGTLLAFSPGAERMFGYAASEVLGRNVRTLMPEPYRSQHDGYLARYHRTGERRIIGIGREVEGRRKDGTTFPIDLAVSEIHVGDRTIYSGVARDLSPLRAAADALRQSEQSLRLLVDGIVDHAMVLLDPDGTVVAWNAGATKIFGYADSEIIGRSVSVLHPAGDPLEPLLAEAFSYGKVQTTTHRVRKDGTEFDAEVTLASVYAHDGTRRAYTTVIDDITEQKAEATRREAVEEQLRQAQRLESVGQLAGGVAHDFNNLLSVVLGSVTLLEGALQHALDASPQRDQVFADLRAIEDAARRGATLTRQLLTFSRRDVVAPQVLNIDEVVDDLTDMLRRTIGEHIDLQVDSDGDDRWRVLVDRGQLEQVLVNLAVNARDAMPDGGTLTLETRNIDLDEAFLQPDARMTPGPYVVVIVSDTGVGMEPEVAARAFEPFFTTKPPGSGTGLGLATIYGIVTGAGGVVRLYSEPGIGTAVKVYFPATLAEVSPGTKPRDVDVRLRHGNERILLVEDETAVRELACRLLIDAGYDVTATANAHEALEAWSDATTPFDLVLTDLIMPGMSGRELAQRLRAQDPSTKVLHMSGYTAGLLGPRAILEEGDALLEKPFTRALLLRRVDTALGPHPATVDAERRAGDHGD